MDEIHIGQVKVPYQVKWSDRESIGIAVEPSKEIEVRAPKSASTDEIRDALEEKKIWILEKIQGFEEQEQPPKDKEFLSGEKLLYCGRRYYLKAENDAADDIQFQFTGDRFHLKTPDFDSEQERVEAVRDTVRQWYKRQAGQKLSERVHKYAEELGQQPELIEVKDYAKTWGKCKEKKIRLNWRLILAPRKIQDYVIVHELTHMRVPNHSPSFWNVVGSILPDYEKRREWLRVNGNKLSI